MNKNDFFNLLSKEVLSYKNLLETDSNQWIIKGVIDVDKNVYTITNDTKVVSKIIEILLIPRLEDFAKRNNLTLELPSKQNFYPDLTFKDDDGHLFAVDLKSSYYNENKRVNGLTLGSYWGYFRNRDTKMNMDYAYNEYCSHLVLGMLYRQTDTTKSEKTTYSIDELTTITSVVNDFIFFVQPKWRVAADLPGSGNTRNIGGEQDISKLINGQGRFAELGEEVFDDYWMNYFNSTDAMKAGIGRAKYHNLSTYKEYLKDQEKHLEKLEK